MKLSVLAGPALFAMLQSGLASAQPVQPGAGWDCPGHWQMWSGGWGFWWIFPLTMMLFMIVLCAFFLMGRPWGRRSAGDDLTASALQLLHERFAKGEIQKEEYEERRAVILRRP